MASELNIEHYLKLCHGDADCERQMRELHEVATGQASFAKDDPALQSAAQTLLSLKAVTYRLQVIEQVLGLRFVDGEYQRVEDMSTTLLGMVADAMRSELEARDVE